MESYVRVRNIIPKLNYKSLIRDDLIPDLDTCFPPDVFVIKKYPPFVYQSKAFDQFGMLVDYIIRGALRIQAKLEVFDQNHDDTTYYTSNNLNAMAEAARQLVIEMYQSEPFTKENIQSYVPMLVNITKEIMNCWNAFDLNGLVMYNSELTQRHVQGHPDILVGDTILDIKTTSSFKSMKEETYLQILSYWALSDEHTTVGVLLPNQRKIAVADLTGFDRHSLRNLLLEVSRPVQMLDITSSILLSSIIFTDLGSTIHKGDDLAKSVLLCNPSQVFVSNARSGKFDRNIDADAIRAGATIKENQLRCYIHSPYIINLCNKPDPDNYHLECLSRNLRIGQQMHAKGVVVHTGARKKTELSEALDVMEQNIRNVLKDATEMCPLMLETPCGEGTEVTTTKESLAEFLNRFSLSEKKKLRLCLDTCHVFVSGIQPIEYLNWWEKNSDVMIGLVHFNDSKTEFGSRKDRHARCGHGYIGMERMVEVYGWCVNHNIDMVTE